ncbi:MAG: universal stress protein [Desulfatirhabdiaceae bacterium]
MTIDIKKILFTSDLSENAKTVFGYAASLADHYHAGIVILHVMEALPPGTENQVADALGKETYQKLKTRKKEGARHILINKKADALRIQEQLADMHQITGAGMENLKRVSIENVIVTEGNVAEEIAVNAVENKCDVIVMGSPHRGLLTETFAGSTVRKVLKRSRLPVFLVPL